MNGRLDDFGEQADEFFRKLLDRASELNIEPNKTYAVVFEVAAEVGIGAVGGDIFVFDEQGFFYMSFTRMSAGVSAGISATAGVIVYNGPRSGLAGFGGAMNINAAYGAGAEYENVMSGGATGHSGGITRFSFAAEFTYTTEIYSWSY